MMLGIQTVQQSTKSTHHPAKIGPFLCIGDLQYWGSIGSRLGQGELGVGSEIAVDVVHYSFLDMTNVMTMIAMDIWTRLPCEFCNSVILGVHCVRCAHFDRCSPGTVVQHGDLHPFWAHRCI